MQRTSSSWPSSTRKHAPHSISHNLVTDRQKSANSNMLKWKDTSRGIDIKIRLRFYRIVLSDEPLTTRRSLYCRQAMPRLWPFSVRTNSHVLVLHTFRRETKEIALWNSSTLSNKVEDRNTHEERLIGQFQTHVNYWLQVLLCHLDCFGDNGSLTLCLFLQLMELECAWFFFFFAKWILYDIFHGNMLFPPKILKRAFWKRLSIQSPYCETLFSTVRLPDILHCGGSHLEIPVTTNLPLISCLGVSKNWSLNSGHWITRYLDGAVPWGRHYIFVVKVDHVYCGPVPDEDTS